MSILLDALRKSEAQRDLGALPTLQTPEFIEAASSAGGKTWIPVLMAMLAAVLIIWMGSAQFKEPETSRSLEPLVTEGTKDAKPGSSVEVSVAPDQAGKALSSVGTAVRNFQSERPQSGSQAAPAGKAAQQAEHAAKSAGTAVKSFAGKTRDTNVTPDVDSNSEDNAGASVPNVGGQGGDTARNARLEPFVAESLSYWQIPQSVREGMPQLHITVLVYAEKPEDRFLLINGERLREQDELTSDLMLEEIQRDRAIFRYRNYRFYLKN